MHRYHTGTHHWRTCRSLGTNPDRCWTLQSLGSGWDLLLLLCTPRTRLSWETSRCRIRFSRHTLALELTLARRWCSLLSVRGRSCTCYRRSHSRSCRICSSWSWCQMMESNQECSLCICRLSLIWRCLNHINHKVWSLSISCSGEENPCKECIAHFQV